MSVNYYRKLSASILSHKKCEIYRDTDVSKKTDFYKNICSFYLPQPEIWKA